MMLRPLFDHLNYITCCDQDFQLAASHGDQERLASHGAVLRQLELCRSTSGVDAEAARRNASWSLAKPLAVIPEEDFPEPPSPQLWAKCAGDQDWLRSLQSTAVRRLASMVRLAGHQDSVALYGNIKSRPVVERKIRDFSSGCAALDLWDLVRFRLVVTSIDSVERVSQLLWSSFGADLLRCRNYYVRPGEGWGDPYRAIHFELKVGTRSPAECVEIQVLTARRDAVGLIDHGIHSKSSRYRDGKHECWLRSLSWTANIMDAEPGLEKSSLHTRPASADGGTVNVSPPCGDGVPASCRPRCRSTVRFSGK